MDFTVLTPSLLAYNEKIRQLVDEHAGEVNRESLVIDSLIACCALLKEVHRFMPRESTYQKLLSCAASVLNEASDLDKELEDTLCDMQLF